MSRLPYIIGILTGVLLLLASVATLRGPHPGADMVLALQSLSNDVFSPDNAPALKAYVDLIVEVKNDIFSLAVLASLSTIVISSYSLIRAWRN